MTPFLFGWLDSQLEQYCISCGIDLDVIDFIRLHESSRASQSKAQQDPSGFRQDSIFINIISWNVRGLGKPNKRHLVRDYLDLHNADVYCTQESKLAVVNKPIYCSIGGTKLGGFYSTSALGSIGDMIIGWKESMFTGLLVHSGNFSLSMEFKSVWDQSS